MGRRESALDLAEAEYGVNQETTKLIIDKIPAFKGFSLPQAARFMRGGRKMSCRQDEVLCREGDPSSHLYILLAGELGIESLEVEIARVKPVNVVGEMGLLTGMERCASVKVVQEAMLIQIGKDTLDGVLQENHQLATIFYRNMLDTLCRRLRQSNAQTLLNQTDLQADLASLIN